MSVRGMRRLLPAALVTSLVTLSCSRDTAPTAPAPQFDGSHATGIRTSAQHTAGLEFCRPLPYAADTATIGPAGGTLHIGPHKLTFPAGALDSTVTIIGEAPSDTLRTVRFTPQGLTFEDAVLVLNYNGCMDRPGDRQHRIAYTDDAHHILYYVEATDHPKQHVVVGEISHFSQYAVGW